MRKQIIAADLQIVAPVVFGVLRLKTNIREAKQVFCVCAVGRDYHLGAWDASETLRRAERRGFLVRTGSPTNLEEDVLYAPADPSQEYRDQMNRDLDFSHKEILRIHRLFQGVYGLEKRIERLEHLGESHDTFLEAFVRLLEFGWLPRPLGNAALNHQGMMLIMEQCFTIEGQLVDFLRQPSLLEATAPNGGNSQPAFVSRSGRPHLGQARLGHVGAGVSAARLSTAHDTKPTVYLKDVGQRALNIGIALIFVLLLAAITGISTQIFPAFLAIIGGVGAGLFIIDSVQVRTLTTRSKIFLYGIGLMLLYEAALVISSMIRIG